MIGAVALGIVVGWFVAANCAAVVHAGWTNAVLRVLAWNLLFFAGTVSVCLLQLGRIGGVMAVTGAAAGALLSILARIQWRRAVTKGSFAREG